MTLLLILHAEIKKERFKMLFFNPRKWVLILETSLGFPSRTKAVVVMLPDTLWSSQ